MINLTGTGVALVTPFHRNEPDFDALGRLLAHTAPHVDYFVVHGTTGESPTTSPEEKRKILEFVKQNNPHKRPIVLGMGGNDTTGLVKSIQSTDFEGVDGLLSVSPYYNKPTQEGIFRHYTAVADASPVPVILYNVPGRTASTISPETTLRLAAHPNILATKDASGDLYRVGEVAAGLPEEGFSLLSGDDLLLISTVAIGGKGVISVLANAFPGAFCRMVRLSLAGDFEAAEKIHSEFVKINTFLYEESNPVGIKEVLAQLGICRNDVRLPLVEASEKLSAVLAEKLKSMNL